MANKMEVFSKNLTWILRAKENSKHYKPFMSVDINGKNAAILRIDERVCPFKFDSIPDILVQVINILSSEKLPGYINNPENEIDEEIPIGTTNIELSEIDDEIEQFSEALTWLLRVRQNSKYYADFMSINLTGDDSAKLQINRHRYPFKFISEADMVAQVVDILGGEELPKV